MRKAEGRMCSQYYSPGVTLQQADCPRWKRLKPERECSVGYQGWKVPGGGGQGEAERGEGRGEEGGDTQRGTGEERVISQNHGT